VLIALEYGYTLEYIDSLTPFQKASLIIGLAWVGKIKLKK
jgi:hypothetical protein